MSAYPLLPPHPPRADQCTHGERGVSLKGVLCVGYLYVEANGQPQEMQDLNIDAAAQYSCLDLSPKSLAAQLSPLEFSEAVSVRVRNIVKTTAYIHL
jgi:hypothetical protein